MKLIWLFNCLNHNSIFRLIEPPGLTLFDKYKIELSEIWNKRIKEEENDQNWKKNTGLFCLMFILGCFWLPNEEDVETCWSPARQIVICLIKREWSHVIWALWSCWSWCPAVRPPSVMWRQSTARYKEFSTSPLIASSLSPPSSASPSRRPRLGTWGSCPRWPSRPGRRRCWRTSSPRSVPSTWRSWTTGRPPSPVSQPADWPLSGAVPASCRTSRRIVCIWMFTLRPQVWSEPAR